MNRRIATVGMIAVLWAASNPSVRAADSSNTPAPAKQSRPNISFILFDDLGYGQPPVFRAESPYKMSRLDRLAREGMRFFPGVPDAWKDAVFHDLRAEGAFFVSAERKNGRTQWVLIKSLAGEPCRIVPSLAGEVKATLPMKLLGNGCYELTLAQGEEALLYTGGQPPSPVVTPLPIAPADRNPYGLK